MMERIQQELSLLRQYYPTLLHSEVGGWVFLPQYRVPERVWNHQLVDVAFQIPPGYPGQKPYAFYVNPRLRTTNGAAPNNYADSNEPPFAGEWGKLSWDLPGWQATGDLQTGSNLLNFVLSFRARLEEGV